MQRLVPMLASLCVLSACAVGPNYSQQNEKVPPQYDGTAQAGAGDKLHLSAETEADANWWRAFNDTDLDQLEDRMLRSNLGLQASLMRIAQSRGQVQVARARGLPSLSGAASYNREQLGFAGILDSQGTSFGAGTLSPGIVAALTSPINLYQIGFDASWELDLFGKVRRSVEAAKAQSEAVVEERNDMLVSLQAEVAQTYLQLRESQLLGEVTAELIDNEREILELTISREKNGLSSDADVESARAQVSTLESQLPQYRQSVEVSRHALAVLVGEQPEALSRDYATSRPLPNVPNLVPVGVPATLARRRPDVRESEATLHGATANIGVAVASLFPDITLTGTLGLRNISASYLFDSASKYYTAGPSISLPIFQGGALVANVAISRAQAAEAAINYRNTVLTALQEVEDALTGLQQDVGRIDSLNATLAANRRAFEITLASYRKGLTTYIVVLNTELQVNQSRVQSTQASLTELTDLVKLYKALGGGWEQGQKTAPASN